jgi:glycosyltransferase involved in cell wall biosynthesis
LSHVSVIIPTFDRAELLRTRSIPSVLCQTHPDWDLHVVGDGSPESVGDAVAEFTDPRIRFTNLPRYPYPEDPLSAWHVAGSQGVNFGLDNAQGPYVCSHGDDDEWHPEFLARMSAKLDAGYDVVYCVSEVVGHGYLGCEFPPRFAGQAGGEWMWRLTDLRLDLDCWRQGMPNDWDLHRRLIMGGSKVGWLPDFIGYRYHPSSHVPPCHSRPPG